MGVISRKIPPLYLDAIRRFRLIDDTFFSLCFDGFKEGMYTVPKDVDTQKEGVG